MLFLAEPSERYKDSYLEAIREFQAEGRHVNDDVTSLNANFAAFVQSLRKRTDRNTLPPELVPESIYWLIDDDEYIGRLSFRHELNDWLRLVGGHIGYEIRPSKRQRGYGKEILRLGLEKVKEYGLPRVLVTCDEDNIGSKKIIEHNGGTFENAVEIEGEPARKLRYWIEVQ